MTGFRGLFFAILELARFCLGDIGYTLKIHPGKVHPVTFASFVIKKHYEKHQRTVRHNLSTGMQ